MSADAAGVPRPAMIIRTIEGRRSKERPVLSEPKFRAQLKLLETKGIRAPRTSDGR